MAKLFKKCCLYIFFPIILAGVGLLFLQLPKYSGVIVSPTKAYNPITITRDEFGVPTIQSKTFRDTLYGLGYVHAQDRLWTIHFRKLLIAGRLSEIFGSEGLVIDKFFRNVSIRRYCENAIDYLNEEEKAQFQAYIDGINDYIRTLKVLPLQFWLTWTEIEEFTLVDAVQSGKFLSFFLAMDFPFEFIFETVEALVGLEKATEIIPHREDKLLWKKTVILNDDDLKQSGIYEPFNESLIYTESVKAKLEVIPTERLPGKAVSCKDGSLDCLGGKGPSSAEKVEKRKQTGVGEKLGEEVKAMKQQYNIGSNCWAVHGNHTTTGKPILASDPHLTNAMPSFWYNVALIHEENHVAGMTLPGLPGIVIGKSKYVAWGLTNLFADTSDIYTITTKGSHYFYEDAWRPLKESKQYMKVRGRSEPEEVILYESHHGVVLDYHLAFPFIGMTFSPSANQTYVLAWVGFINTKTSIAPVLRLPNARNAQAVLDLWKGSVEPSLSFVFATTEGDIGYISLGKIPVRRQVSDGTKPRDGSKKENDWLGFVPWEDQPKVVNPKKGFIVSANNKIATDNVKWRVSSNLMLTSRAARIDEMIREFVEKGKKISVEDTKKMQADTMDILAREVVPTIEDDVRKALEDEKLVKGLKTGKKELLGLIERLNKWDFRMDKDSVPAGIFGVWQTFFLRKVLRKIGLSDEDRHSIIGCFKIDHFVYRKLMEMDNNVDGYHDYWCQDDENPMTGKSCLWILAKALDETSEYFKEKVGVDVEKWTWGSVHTMEYPHEPFNMTPLKKLFQRSKGAPGNSRTVFVSGMQPHKDGFEGIWSPNTRMVASLKEGEKSYFVIDTGVSDIAMSKHYDDQMELYYKGGYIEMNEGVPKNWTEKLEIKFGRQ